MTPYHHLRQLAREKRDQAIHEASEEYSQTLRTITSLSRNLDGKNGLLTPIGRRRLRATPDRPFSELSLIAAAELILRELGPLRLTELAVEIRSRGNRT